MKRAMPANERRYTHVEGGRWYELRPRRNVKLACCDCGLVHKINFRVTGGRLQAQMWRDPKATANLRRGSNGRT